MLLVRCAFQFIESFRIWRLTARVSVSASKALFSAFVDDDASFALTSVILTGLATSILSLFFLSQHVHPTIAPSSLTAAIIEDIRSPSHDLIDPSMGISCMSSGLPLSMIFENGLNAAKGTRTSSAIILGEE
ncbi:hypothetical protein N7520_011323 [Penicillium odoratum]|uniref:uncharacterized protein n=1 Tax=Penicillium odoratum TaxID=1167516 RepID=UPI0025496723|nr:uncharacterized protein N7520_011323 [Penicillium odoratum]KAJ5746141.1 hypothetical protein N7520_011323 [Penicillium odoratum]